MAWQAYRLIYRARSPIHIGWHTLGYINLTRYYIPGKNMWGSMTSNLARMYGRQQMSAYSMFGDLLKTDVLASYFYPALDTEEPLLPHFTERGIFHGKYAKHDFERDFIGSFGQTAILPGSNTAEDESLHEAEFISAMTRSIEGTGKQVLFVGYVFIKGDARTSDGRPVLWKTPAEKPDAIGIGSAITELFVGGERKYGWGRLELKEIQRLGPNDTFFGCPLDLSGMHPVIDMESPRAVSAHIPIDCGCRLKGDLEPLVGREWQSRREKDSGIGAGQHVTRAAICWVPGSVLLDAQKIKICEYGLLRKRDE